VNAKQKKRVVVVGGGTGMYTVLRGLKRYTHEIEITAIVGMTDSGGSTGRLRDEFGYLPVGDARMALVALAPEARDTEKLLRELFLHRFASNGAVGGHNFGNLFLVALTDILGTEEEAIRAASRVLRTDGEVIPVTNAKVHLRAQYTDTTEVVGEHEIECIDDTGDVKRIATLTTTDVASINANAREALMRADMIVFGPGDLYTSILANCVAEGFPDALSKSLARTVYISNLMTRNGQTTGMGVAAHLAELEKYIAHSINHIVVNTTPLPDDILERYQSEGEFPVILDIPSNDSRVLGIDLLANEVIAEKKGDVLRRSLIRHDSQKIAQVLVHIVHM
jgi:uncharacterized cofD-like protein